MISASEFWDWFKNNDSQFFFLSQVQDENEKERILEELHHRLNQFSEGLFFEIGGHPDDIQDLVITARGDVTYFAKVEELVENAPEMDNWNVIAFKPPINESFELNYEDISINSNDILFSIQENEAGLLEITLFFKNLDTKYESQYGEVSNLILETLLGEKDYFEKVESVFFDELIIDETNNRNTITESKKIYLTYLVDSYSFTVNIFMIIVFFIIETNIIDTPT